MHKKTYKLKDIEKILTFTPPIFILLLTALSLMILLVVIEYRQNSEIRIYKQREKFGKINKLSVYVDSVDTQVKQELDKVEENIKQSVHILKGVSLGLVDRKTRIDRLLMYAKVLERKSSIRFLIFDDRLNILHGQRVARSVRNLIFGEKRGKTHLDLTLLYIKSQGDNSSMSWGDDIKKTIQLSYFTVDAENKIYIGAFSLVDRFRNLTTTAYINAIASAIYNPSNYYFWLYDHDMHKAYNLDNHMQWQKISNMPIGYSTHAIDRYNISIGIGKIAEDNRKILEITDRFERKKYQIIMIILSVVIILLLFTFIFSNFVKKIFTSFSKKEERKNQQIASLKERYELAVIASNDGLWDTNFKTKKTFFSKKWLDMMGYDRSDIRSYDDWLSIIHPDDLHRVIEDIREHTSDKYKEHLVCEYRLKKKNGEYIWVLGRGKAFVDESGKAVKLSMMSMDIDEKKAADKKLKELVKKELAKNERKRRLLIQQNKMAAMGEMIGAIAHQWRQPLNNISLILHFIRDNAKDRDFVENKMSDFVNRAKSQIEYMSDTIDDFRDFYQPTKERVEFCVANAIEAIKIIASTQIERNNIELSIKGEPVKVYGYENEFKQAILNIVSNATDAIVSRKLKQGNFQGKIDITVSKEMIRIYNNGGFATSEVIDRMFEPYFTTKFEDKGTGIGLYMTKMIVENSMGGEISARNIDEGVEFTIKGMR